MFSSCVANAELRHPRYAALNEDDTGYLNYIIFDENNVFSQFGYKAISTAALNAFEKLSLEIDVPSNGTLYIYVANESNVNSNVNVFFDDLLIVHEKNSMGLEVKSSADYYPFGAQIGSLSYQKSASFKNSYGYQGVYAELDEETGWHAFELRQYDSYLGRWTGVDPYSQYSSPYVGMGNIPHMGVDPDGGLFGMGAIASGAVIGATVATAVGAIVDDNFSNNWYKWTLGGAAAGAGLGFAYERATSVYTATGRTAKDPKYSSSQSLKKGGSFKLPSVNIPSGVGDAVNLVSSVGSASGFVGASSRFPEIDRIQLNGGNDWDLNGDGVLSLNEANNHFRNGGGVPITVDASNITFTNVDPRKLSTKGKTGINFEKRGPAKIGLVYGTLDLILVGENQVSILPNPYDFKVGAKHGHPWFKSVKGFVRNVGTIFGRTLSGPGKSFMINFSGLANLNFQPTIPITNPRVR